MECAIRRARESSILNGLESSSKNETQPRHALGNISVAFSESFFRAYASLRAFEARKSSSVEVAEVPYSLQALHSCLFLLQPDRISCCHCVVRPQFFPDLKIALISARRRACEPVGQEASPKELATTMSPSDRLIIVGSSVRGLSSPLERVFAERSAATRWLDGRDSRALLAFSPSTHHSAARCRT